MPDWVAEGAEDVLEVVPVPVDEPEVEELRVTPKPDEVEAVPLTTVVTVVETELDLPDELTEVAELVETRVELVKVEAPTKNSGVLESTLFASVMGVATRE